MNDMFTNKFCLNLDRRPDRWDKAKAQFDSVGFDVTRLSAVDGSLLKDKNPELAKYFNPKEVGIWPKIGLMKSWEKAVDLAMDSQLKNITIFEDDLEFCENFNNSYETLADKLPEEWDIIFFANNRVAPTGYEPPQGDIPFLAAGQSIVMGLHFVTVNSKAFPKIKKYLSSGINIMRVLNDYTAFSRYYSKNSLAQQTEGYSDIRGRYLKSYEI